VSVTPEENRRVPALALPVVEGEADGEALYEYAVQVRGQPPALARAIVEGYVRMGRGPLRNQWIEEARDILRDHQS
jgi:hypothetical protein